jgi:hypothetical protein
MMISYWRTEALPAILKHVKKKKTKGEVPMNMPKASTPLTECAMNFADNTTVI